MESEGKVLDALGNADKIQKKEGRGQCASEGMDEEFLRRVMSERRSWATVRGVSQFSFTYSLLTPHSCLIISFILVNMHAIYSCKTINPNLFIIQRSCIQFMAFPHKSNLSGLSILNILIMAAIPKLQGMSPPQWECRGLENQLRTAVRGGCELAPRLEAG